MQCRQRDRRRPGPAAADCPRARPAAALQTTTTDVSMQNNTGPLGGPVIIMNNSAHSHWTHWNKLYEYFIDRLLCTFMRDAYNSMQGSHCLGDKNFQDFTCTFRTWGAFFQDPVVRQRCLNIKTKNSYYGAWGKAPASSDFFVCTDKIRANFCKFWHLHLHHWACSEIRSRVLRSATVPFFLS